MRLRSDEQLVGQFRAGSDEAFRAIHDRYHGHLVAYARQMLGRSHQDAEDAVQDVFLRAYGALRAGERPVSLRSWLYFIAHNRCVDLRRRLAPEPRDVLAAGRTPQADPTQVTERREKLRSLVGDLQRLPEQQRSALLMRELQGLSYAELALALGLSVPAVKSLLVRARRSLADAATARDATCESIREELAAACERGVRASGLAWRHLRECDSCRSYRNGLHGVRRGLSALGPAGPLSAILLRLGESGVVAGVSATTTKMALVVATAAITAGGVTAVRESPPPARVQTTARPARATVAPQPSPVTPARPARARSTIAPPVRSRRRVVSVPAHRDVGRVVALDTGSTGPQSTSTPDTSAATPMPERPSAGTVSPTPGASATATPEKPSATPDKPTVAAVNPAPSATATPTASAPKPTAAWRPAPTSTPTAQPPPPSTTSPAAAVPTASATPAATKPSPSAVIPPRTPTPSPGS